MLAVGNPARVMCTVDEYMTKVKSEIKDDNTFGDEYTLRNPNFGQEQTSKMIEASNQQKYIFVK